MIRSKGYMRDGGLTSSRLTELEGFSPGIECQQSNDLPGFFGQGRCCMN